MANYEKKSSSMNQYKQMQKNHKVAAKKQELKDWMKQKFKSSRKSAEDWRVETKEGRDEAREVLLNDGFFMLESSMEAFRDHKKAWIKASG
jgi:DNA-binding transcriptional regulator YbjK